MSSPIQDTSTALRQISANCSKCLSLWRNIMGLCENWSVMNKGVIREKSIELEETFQQGEGADIPYVLPHAKGAFNQGDERSQGELRRVMESQMNLMDNLVNISHQLAAATEPAPRDGPRRTPNPERVLDIDTIWSLVDSVKTQRENTTEALQALAKRVSDMTPPPRSQNRQGPPLPGSFPSGQQYAYPQTPVADPGGRSPSLKNNDISPQPALRLRSEQVPPQPPRPAQSVVDLSPSFSPPLQQSTSRTRRRPGEKQAEMQMERPVNAPVERPIERAVQHGPNDPRVTPIPPSTQNISYEAGKYCVGAIRLQQNPQLSIADIVRHDISTSPGIKAHSICKHCNLELDTSLPGEMLPAEEKRNFMAMQHIMACASLMDSKAMFRCLACEKKERDAEFRGVGELWGHMNWAHVKSR